MQQQADKMEKTLSILKNTLLFVNVAEDDLSDMLNCLSAKTKTFRKDDYIWMAGDPADTVGIVLSGVALIIREDFWGNRAVIDKLESGQIFGEAFSCAQTEHIYVSVMALERTEVLFMDYKKIVTTCSSACIFHVSLIKNMLRILGKKNIMLTQKMDFMAKRTIREKLLAYLSSQAMEKRDNCFSIPFSRQELADYLATDRSAMSRELSKLRDEGVLEFERNRFHLNKEFHNHFK